MNGTDERLRTVTFPPGSSAGDRVAKRVLLLPGSAYPVEAPLLFWTCCGLVEDGWFVQAVRWQPEEQDGHDFVARALGLLEHDAPSAQVTLVVAKSLGTLAAPVAARRGLPAVWLTPVLTDEAVSAALASYPAPQLVVGGTADPLWPEGAVVAGDALYVDGADHAMHRGSPRESATVHLDVAERVVDFARSLTT